MNKVGQTERETQNRVVRLFRDELGYDYLDNWQYRENNSNIEEEILGGWLTERGYNQTLIAKALHILQNAANNYNEDLYNNNKNVHSLLRYGAQVKAELGRNTDTVHFIDWRHPEKNNFAIAEEVTIKERRVKRPDIVLYVNGIALGVLELKRGIVLVSEAMRQSIGNQGKRFISQFFTTIQFVFVGNDTEGLRYGTIGTPEKFFLKWKEDIEDDSRFPLDKYLLKMCDKKRLVELTRDFVLFDGGRKKLPRAHQYFGIKAAQEHIQRREGGIIWHTQGSGKSIVMVLLARWILENNPHARVAVITDRDELDKQIKRIFNDAGESVERASSGRDLMRLLSQAEHRLLCSLVHKFGKAGAENFERFIQELESGPSQTAGELFVFVDECHRTQSGKLHRVMKAILPDAVFIGFTGAPLLKKDKQTSLEVFGKYIHTYKFNEAVDDKVILDLVYEARDIDQRLTAPEKVDEWFEGKTRALNNFQKAELRKKWGTMSKTLSSKNRLEKVVNDIVFDFNLKPRLSSGQGNAILVASSIYEACRYYDLFQKTEFKGKCALVTSYNPHTRDIVSENTGANTETAKQYIYNTYLRLLAKAGKTKTESYEDEVKDKFIKEPANTRLMIVVDKLLTGFDAPSCTYLYIDKSMRDHGLFQAICRVNRLDSEDKQFGYIVDYKDLFKRVEKAVAVYTAELDYDEFEKRDCDILLQDRLKKGRERLDNALEVLRLLREPVERPKGKLEHIRYFCGNTEIPEDLKAREAQRYSLYKGVVVFIRSYANIADEMEAAGYTEEENRKIKERLDFYIKLREEIRIASGERLDLKAYEADMRHLIDNYIQADEAVNISPFGDLSLIELIVKTGIADAVAAMPSGVKGSERAVAETIENNVRSRITQDRLIDPAFFDKISILLSAIIKERKENAIGYEKYLQKIADLAKRVNKGASDNMPEKMNTPAKRAIYSNLDNNEELACSVHEAMEVYRPKGWRDNPVKERIIKGNLYNALDKDVEKVEKIFPIIKEQDEY